MNLFVEKYWSLSRVVDTASWKSLVRNLLKPLYSLEISPHPSNAAEQDFRFMKDDTCEEEEGWAAYALHLTGWFTSTAPRTCSMRSSAPFFLDHRQVSLTLLWVKKRMGPGRKREWCTYRFVASHLRGKVKASHHSLLPPLLIQNTQRRGNLLAAAITLPWITPILWLFKEPARSILSGSTEEIGTCRLHHQLQSYITSLLWMIVFI